MRLFVSFSICIVGFLLGCQPRTCCGASLTQAVNGRLRGELRKFVATGTGAVTSTGDGMVDVNVAREDAFWTKVRNFFRRIFGLPVTASAELVISVDSMSEMGKRLVELQSPAIQQAIVDAGLGEGDMKTVWNTIKANGGMKGLTADETSLYKSIVKQQVANIKNNPAEQAKYEESTVKLDASEVDASEFEDGRFRNSEFSKAELNDLVEAGEAGEGVADALKVVKDLK